MVLSELPTETVVLIATRPVDAHSQNVVHSRPGAQQCDSLRWKNEWTPVLARLTLSLKCVIHSG